MLVIRPLVTPVEAGFAPPPTPPRGPLSIFTLQYTQSSYLGFCVTPGEATLGGSARGRQLQKIKMAGPLSEPWCDSEAGKRALRPEEGRELGPFQV